MIFTIEDVAHSVYSASRWRGLPIALALSQLVWSLCIGYVNVATMSWLQKQCPAEEMGRVLMSLIHARLVRLNPNLNLCRWLVADNHLTLMFSASG